MKIVKIQGGLGNQMFQYAFAMSLEQQGHKVFLDTSLYRQKTLRGGINFCHNGIELDKLFGIVWNEASPKLIKKLSTSSQGYFNRFCRKYFTKKTHYIDTLFKYNPALLKDPADCYLEGFWQTEKYFLDIAFLVQKTFTFCQAFSKQSAEAAKNILAAQANSEQNSCASIHVRRGDFLQTCTLFVCTENYYKNAIEKLLISAKLSCFYVFSDDIAWCRENLNLYNIPAVFVDWNFGADSWQDMALMSLCKYNIIANSSFSWWAAWLNTNQNKRVLSPIVWNRRQLDYNDRYYAYDYSDVVPKHWEHIAI